MRARASHQLIEHVVKGNRGTVRPGRDHCVEGIGDGEYPGRQWYVMSGQPIGVPAPVELFVVVEYDLARLSEKIDVLDHGKAQIAVLLHDRHLLFVQRTLLEEQILRNTDFSDVVQV